MSMQILVVPVCYRRPQLIDFASLRALPAIAYLLMPEALRTIRIAGYDPLAFVIEPVRAV
jgi:hypothetical protein